MADKPLIYQFDNVLVETEEFRVLRNGEPVTLEPKAFAVLIFLIENRGRLISKDEMLDAAWKDSFVTPNALTRVVAQLRRALGDASQNSRYIETVPTRGYRFIADVAETNGRTNGESASISFDQDKPNEDLTIEPLEQIGATSVLNETPGKPNFWKSRAGIISSILLLFMLVAGIAYLAVSKSPAKADAAPEGFGRTIAVLPFKLLSPNNENDYLSVGLADSLITKLSNAHSLTVRPTSSVIRYASGETDPAAAGRELNVESVLDGTVQQAGDSVRVTVQFVRVSDGSLIWADSYDAPFVTIFQVQDEISARITESLKIRLTAEERMRLERRPTENIEAYQLCLRGYYHLYKLTPDDVRTSLRYFNEAIALDPNYAFAYAGLAYANGIASSFNVPQAAQLAENAAVKAVTLDPDLGEAHAALAAIQYWGHHDAGKAQDSFVHSLELNPNSAVTHQYYGWFLVATAHFDEAERHFRRALELDPTNSAISFDQGLPLFFDRRYAEARITFARSLELDNNSWYGHMWLGEACGEAGDLECALREIKRASELSPSDPIMPAIRARMLGLAGKKDEARQILRTLTAKDASPGSSYFIALTYAALGDRDNAFASLERAIKEKDKWLGWVKVDPRLDTLRQDARFDDLLRRADLK